LDYIFFFKLGLNISALQHFWDRVGGQPRL